MAYDKIIPIQRRLDHCVDYALNEEKTSLENVLAYTENPAKTRQLVTGINCDPDCAYQDMQATKRRWGSFPHKAWGTALRGQHTITSSRSRTPGTLAPLPATIA